MADRDPDVAASDHRSEDAPRSDRGAGPPTDARDPRDEEAGEATDSATGDDGSGAGRADSGGGSFLRELPVLLLIAFVLAFLLRTFVLQVFYIPSASMEPTLVVNDRMVVEKVTYLFREPERGEIVVFEGEDALPEPDGGAVAGVVRGVGQFLGVVPASAQDFVKRVIGLPGDEVRIVAGEVSVNGVPLDEPYAVPEETDYGPVIVPEGALFFLGDNRPNSSDSRRSLGFVERDNVVGRAVVTIFPLSNAGSLTGPSFDQVPDADIVPPDPDDVPDADDVAES